ncbi:MAG TPA: hypothetical protein VJT71_11800, partial [Pyrinomonadaceae bacterium]|nr:hypothetical protein [Pyrinomonadaceae bacterium]
MKVTATHNSVLRKLARGLRAAALAGGVLFCAAAPVIAQQADEALPQQEGWFPDIFGTYTFTIIFVVLLVVAVIVWRKKSS